MRLGQLEPDLGVLRLTRPNPGGPRLFALLLHGDLEPRHIDDATLFAQRVLRQVQRKAVSIIQLERCWPRQFAALGQMRQFVVQQLQPAV